MQLMSDQPGVDIGGRMSCDGSARLSGCRRSATCPGPANRRARASTVSVPTTTSRPHPDQVPAAGVRRPRGDHRRRGDAVRHRRRPGARLPRPRATTDARRPATATNDPRLGGLAPTAAEPARLRRRRLNPATRSRRSSRARRTSSPWPPRCGRRDARPGPTTRCSSTARPDSARPTCCTPSATTSTTTTSTTTCATSPPRRSSTSSSTPSAPTRSTAFQRRYREIDALLIDDIQFLEGKEACRRSSSTRSTPCMAPTSRSSSRPTACPTRSPRSRNGCAAGSSGADHRHPAARPRDPDGDPAQQGRARSRSGPRRRLEFIASKIPSNIRELEGALIRVTAYASLNRRADHHRVGPAAARRPARRQQGQAAHRRRASTEIADILGFEVEALKGKSRQRPLVTARQIAMYVFRDLTDLSYPSIARMFGGRDHTT